MDQIQFKDVTLTKPSPYEEYNFESEFAKAYMNSFNQDYITQYSTLANENPSLYLQFKNYNVKTTYEEFYPLFFNLDPSVGGYYYFPEAEFIFGFMPIAYTRYQSSYELTYPTVFSITNPNSAEDYVFQFAMEANIRHNQPLAEVNDEDRIQIPTPAEEVGQTLICNPSQFRSKKVYLEIFDPIQNGQRNTIRDPLKGVEDAQIVFDCKGIARCPIGVTEINGNSYIKNGSNMELRLPVDCYPGTLELIKPGHKTLKFENINPNYDVIINLTEQYDETQRYMSSKKNIDLDIFLVPPYTTIGGITGVQQSLKSGEYGFVMFEHLEDNTLSEVVEVTPENQHNLKVDLSSGKYKISSFVITENPFTIPEEKMCVEEGFLDSITGDCKEVTLEEINLDGWILGSYEYEYEIEPASLVNANKMTIKIKSVGIPNSYDKLSESATITGESKTTSLPPTLSN
jgi:hypothetical protein